jgi:tetratricopeptide (TPR) repeat protein
VIASRSSKDRSVLVCYSLIVRNWRKIAITLINRIVSVIACLQQLSFCKKCSADAFQQREAILARRFRLVLTLVLLATTTAPCAVTDRQMFRKAADATRSANSDDRWYALTEIAKAQARRGYYDDALKTLKRTDQFPALNFADIVEIRATNGDMAGAKSMLGRAPNAEAKWWALRNLGLVQAESGDIENARKTVLRAPAIFQQVVLRTIGFHQVQSGALEAALRTVDEMERGEGDGVLVAVAAAVSKRGDEDRARSILSRITDPDVIQELNQPDKAPSSGQEQNACNIAWQEAQSGKFASASGRLEGATCDCTVVAFVREQSGDLESAARAVQSCTISANVSSGMAELATRAASKGDIQAALRFASAVHVSGADYEEGYLAPVLRDIARSWVSKDQKAALKWAKSRPKGYQRAMALLGLAEGISRPESI